MNNVKRNLLIVLIAGAVSTYSHGMAHAALIGEDDAKRMEAQASGSTATTVAPQPTQEGLKSPLEGVLPGQVRASSPAPRVKSELETTVRHGDSPTTDAASQSNGDLIGAQTRAEATTPPPARPDSPSSSSSSDGEYFSAPEAGSAIRRNLSDSELAKQRAAATADQFAQARAQVGKPPVDARPASREASAEVPAAAGTKKADSSSALPRDPSSDALPIEEAMLRRPVADKPAAASSATTTSTSAASEEGAGTGLSPAPVAPPVRSTVTFAEPDPAKSAAGLAEKAKEMGGSVDAERLAAAAHARKDEAPVDLLGGKRENAGSVSASSSSDSESEVVAPGAAIDPVVDASGAKPAALQKDSLLEKVKRNKLKTFALILALAEAADLTQAYFLKTTKEELQDKTLMQKAKLIASKTYTAKLLGAAKEGLKNRVVPGILDLKQKAQTFLNKKQQTT